MKSTAAKGLLLPLVLFGTFGCGTNDEGREEPATSQVSEALFSFPRLTEGHYPFEIVAAHSNKCIEIVSAATPGNELQQYSCNSGHNQAWRLDGSVRHVTGEGGGKTVENAGYSPMNFYDHHLTDAFASWQLQDDSSANGNRLIYQYVNQGSERNGFEFFQKSDKSFEIRTEFEKCVDVYQQSISNGADVQQYNCLNGTNQRFKIRPQRAQAAIQRHGTDLCLEVANSSTVNGGSVQQHGCNDPATTSNQRFYLKDMEWSSFPGPYYNIEVAHSGKCLAVAGSSLANGASVQQTTCISSASNQKWAVNVKYWGSNGGGAGITFVNKNSGKCLDIENGALTDGTNVRQYDCQNQVVVSELIPAANQLFEFFEIG